MKNVMRCLPSRKDERRVGLSTPWPLAAVFLWALSLPLVVQGAELEVRQSGGADHTTVQAAINAASPGDTITILDSATYAEDLSFGSLGPPFGPNGRPNLTLQSATGERPTIQAVNTGDRFGQMTPDFNGVLIMSEGVTLRGLNILNGADASGAMLGLAAALSIQARNVSIIDCDISMAGGVAAPRVSVAALVSDLGRLGGLPATVDNVLFRDCTIHDGTRIGIAVFPVAFELNPAVVGSVLHATLDGGVIRDNVGTGLEADGLGSLTLTKVTVQSNGGNGLELAIEQPILTGCEVLDNIDIGITTAPPDQTPDAVTMVLSATDINCSGNGGDGIHLAEGTAGFTNLTCLSNGDDGLQVDAGPVNVAYLVSATNGASNLRIGLSDPVALQVDHATLYYPEADPRNLPNVYLDAGMSVSGPSLAVKNSILVGPMSFDGFQDIIEEDMVFDTSMFWNGGAPVASHVNFTVANEVTSVDPLLVDPPNNDYRLMATSPVANADDQMGPLGGGGIVVVLPADIAIDTAGIAGGQFFLEWEGTPSLTFDVHGGSGMDTGTWTVIDSVPGATGTQHWDDTRPAVTSHFYRVEGRQP